jgi:hypothetical protein
VCTAGDSWVIIPFSPKGQRSGIGERWRDPASAGEREEQAWSNAW